MPNFEFAQKLALWKKVMFNFAHFLIGSFVELGGGGAKFAA